MRNLLIVLGCLALFSGSGMVSAQTVGAPSVIMTKATGVTPLPLVVGPQSLETYEVYSNDDRMMLRSIVFRLYQAGEVDLSEYELAINSNVAAASVTVTEDKHHQHLVKFDLQEIVGLPAYQLTQVAMIATLSNLSKDALLFPMVETVEYRTFARVKFTDYGQYPILGTPRTEMQVSPMAIANQTDGAMQEMINLYGQSMTDWVVVVIPSGTYNELLVIPHTGNYLLIGVGPTRPSFSSEQPWSMVIPTNTNAVVHNLSLTAYGQGDYYYHGTVFGDMGSSFEVVNCDIVGNWNGVTGSYNHVATIADSNIRMYPPRRGTTGILLAYQNTIGVGTGARVYRNNISRSDVGINFSFGYVPGELSPGSTTIDSNSYRAVRTSFLPTLGQ